MTQDDETGGQWPERLTVRARTAQDFGRKKIRPAVHSLNHRPASMIELRMDGNSDFEFSFAPAVPYAASLDTGS